MPWDVGNWDSGKTWDSDGASPQKGIGMAYDQTRRFNPKDLQRDIDTFAAIKTLTPTYAPSDSHYTVATLL
jgi:hypothetical protein